MNQKPLSEIRDSTRGFYIGSHYVRVDDTDIEMLSKHTWRVLRSRGNGLYAITTIARKLVRMHRLIVGARPGEVVDHINRDTLDNRRSNLRIVTHSLNMRNKGPIKRKSALPKNIAITTYGNFCVQFKLNGKKQVSKTFKTLAEAVIYRDQWMQENSWLTK